MDSWLRSLIVEVMLTRWKRSYHIISERRMLSSTMHRRGFLKTAGLVSLANFPHHLFAQETKRFATDRVKLGPMDVEVSLLAMGSGTSGSGGSSNQTKKLGVQGLADHFRMGFDQGVT